MNIDCRSSGLEEKRIGIFDVKLVCLSQTGVNTLYMEMVIIIHHALNKDNASYLPQEYCTFFLGKQHHFSSK